MEPENLLNSYKSYSIWIMLTCMKFTLPDTLNPIHIDFVFSEGRVD